MDLSEDERKLLAQAVEVVYKSGIGQSKQGAIFSLQFNNLVDRLIAPQPPKPEVAEKPALKKVD